MSLVREEDAMEAAARAAAPAAACPAEEPLRLGWRRLRQAFRQIFGIPDYERYLAHAAEHHGGEDALSRREFFVRSIDRKHGKSGPRCC